MRVIIEKKKGNRIPVGQDLSSINHWTPACRNSADVALGVTFPSIGEIARKLQEDGKGDIIDNLDDVVSLPNGWKRGDTAYYIGSEKDLGGGRVLKYGDEGTVVDDAMIDDEEGTIPGLTIQFDGFKQEEGIDVMDVVKEDPNGLGHADGRDGSDGPDSSYEELAEIPGGYALGDVVYYTGPGAEFACDTKLSYGTRGEVLGASDRPDLVKVQFDEMANPTDLHPTSLSSTKTPSDEASGFNIGSCVYLAMPEVQVNDIVVLHGHKGEIVGFSDGGRVVVRFDGVQPNVDIATTNLWHDRHDGFVKANILPAEPVAVRV